MKRTTWITVAAVVVAVFSMGCGPPPELSCVVQGTPVEFPNDISITNDGSASVPAGTTIEWSHPFASGTHVLTEDLDPGESFFVLEALAPEADEAGSECSANVA